MFIQFATRAENSSRLNIFLLNLGKNKKKKILLRGFPIYTYVTFTHILVPRNEARTPA